MKIQLQNTSFYPATGGIENYLYYASKTLLKMGHEPTILCSQHQPNLPTKENYEGIKIIRHPYYSLPLIPFAPINPIYYVKKLQKFLGNNSEDYDTIWPRILYDAYATGKVFQNKIPIIFIQAAIATNLSEISSANSGLVSKVYAKSIHMQYNFIEKRAIEMSDKVVVLSHSRMREVCDFYNLSKEKFEVITPGVDLEFFKPSEKDKMLLRELSLPNNSKIILTVCRLSHEKNLEMLIRAFNKINIKNAYLVFVGDGPERIYLERLVDLLNIINRIRFVGTRKDVERFYSIADVFVLPSTYEGFGQVFIEAMASGVPCIGLKSDYPNVVVACDEIIRNGRSGYLANAYSIDDLADKIEKIISNDNLRDKLGIESRKICEEEYTWKKCVGTLLELSQTILKKL
ncbi:glycosyltransferase family 4 protein [Methanothrix soehngenii]|uniref:glycosyltransferase family 4 protein n=1 Tax=Methanothrix soehngenii TaxID=2223 RepID=UPI0023521711|nr:glycosyltransferase family 4 protein [Methanothrix soehngenii]